MVVVGVPTGYLCFKENLFASWAQQNGAVSPMVSSSRCYRIPHSSAALQEHSAKFPHSPLFVPLSCRCTALGLAPSPVFECQLALREEADFSQLQCPVPHPSVLECARNMSGCCLGNLASGTHRASFDRADQF